MYKLASKIMALSYDQAIRQPENVFSFTYSCMHVFTRFSMMVCNSPVVDYQSIGQGFRSPTRAGAEAKKMKSLTIHTHGCISGLT